MEFEVRLAIEEVVDREADGVEAKVPTLASPPSVSRRREGIEARGQEEIFE